MIKIVFCLHRLPRLSRAEFQDYWRTVHAPLVAQHADVLGIHRYVQSHTLDDAAFAGLTASRGGAGPYDGIAELWVDAAQRSGAARAEARRASTLLLEDERKFIDLPRSPLFQVRMDEILGLRS